MITLDPARLVDSRFGSGYQTVDGQQQGIGRRAAGQTTIVPVAGRTGIPAGAVTAILNIVAINAERQGFAAIYDCDEDRPNTSTLNLGAGTTIANRAIIGLDTDGAVCVYTQRAMDLVIDVTGYTT